MLIQDSPLVLDLPALLDPRYINRQLRVQHPPATGVGNKDTCQPVPTVLRGGKHVATAIRPITSRKTDTANEHYSKNFNSKGRERKKVESKLEELERMDVIEKVESPSQWVSPVIVVPKPGGKDVRLVVDMRAANQAVMRERHPIPTVDEVLHDMNGAKVFSKLDLKYGYH
ncbi:hypothetical protein RRG08_010492 [Elysia crispata]|uniref:Reverse transcriptase domain-containing protein n=1 Tax=Elysia crispata TaxID=231223 RepID=A0AAE1ANN5_9GAST|nr:hypothetical protein RRG08_010492 [Elysia crispata]